jgi:hypothetical protein
MLIQSCTGLSITGNTGYVDRDDGGGGELTPNYAFRVKDSSCSLITANVFSDGYLKEMILDKGGNKPDFLINNNVGTVYQGLRCLRMKESRQGG